MAVAGTMVTGSMDMLMFAVVEGFVKVVKVVAVVKIVKVVKAVKVVKVMQVVKVKVVMVWKVLMESHSQVGTRIDCTGDHNSRYHR